jgi:hypothetical protein
MASQAVGLLAPCRGGDATKKVRGLKWGLLPMFKKKSIIIIFSMWLAVAKLGPLL